MIQLDDPRHAAATRVLEAMHDFWKLEPCNGAVQWIEDSDGRLVVFTRGEYRNRIQEAIKDNPQGVEYFKLENSDAG